MANVAFAAWYGAFQCLESRAPREASKSTGQNLVGKGRQETLDPPGLRVKTSMLKGETQSPDLCRAVGLSPFPSCAGLLVFPFSGLPFSVRDFFCYSWASFFPGHRTWKAEWVSSVLKSHMKQ